MRFSSPPRRRPAESIVPMINVVFLLLIFFMMAARIAPPQPFDLTPPVAESEAQPAEARALSLSKDGALAFGAARGEAVWAALGAHGSGPLVLRADQDMPAPMLAAVLAQLAEIGISDIELAVRVR